VGGAKEKATHWWIIDKMVAGSPSPVFMSLSPPSSNFSCYKDFFSIPYINKYIARDIYRAKLIIKMLP
jgi:hypothetical protein